MQPALSSFPWVEYSSPKYACLNSERDVHVPIAMCRLRFALPGLGKPEENKNGPATVDCAQPSMRQHTYWPLNSDFINVLHHRSIARRLITSPKLLHSWLQIVALFQGTHRTIVHYVFKSSPWNLPNYVACTCWNKTIGLIKLVKLQLMYTSCNYYSNWSSYN